MLPDLFLKNLPQEQQKELFYGTVAYAHATMFSAACAARRAKNTKLKSVPRKITTIVTTTTKTVTETIIE